MTRQKLDKAEEYRYDPEEVFNVYYGALCYYASRFVENEEAAEDIVQDVFTVLLEKKLRFDSEAHIKNHLYLSVKNGCLNYLRKEIARSRYLDFLKKEASEEEDQVVLSEVYRLLSEAIDRLPAECRKVFRLAYFEGLDNDQVAERLELSIHTVKAQKARGKKILRSKLEGGEALLLLLIQWMED